MLRKRFNSVLAATLLTVTTGTAMAVGDPKDTGDIVMRDMKGLGGLIGHVGIWTGSDLLGVLEVVPESPVIKTTFLKDFKAASTYRGATYDGKGSAAHYKVIASGLAQRLFAPTYTPIPMAREGKMEFKCKNPTKPNCQKEWVLTPAMFRCDTFVWYAYKNGIGVDLLGRLPVGLSTPNTIFNSVLNTR